MTLSLHGVAVSPGVAIGCVHIVERNRLETAEYRLKMSEIDGEIQRLLSAITQAKEHLKAIREHIPASTPSGIASFIDTHLLMLDDDAFNDEPVRLIREQRCNAEWAVKLQRDALVAVFEQMGDPYLRTRKDDVDHVIDRILRNLSREASSHHEVPDRRLKDMIVLADDLAPADLILIQQHGVTGFVTEFGGPTSHLSILARSLELPGVVGIHSARRYFAKNELLVVDGDDGVVIADASSKLLDQYRGRQKKRRNYFAKLRVLKDEPTETSDGVAVQLHANVELPEECQSVRDVGATAVGLYRTEYLFANRASYPEETVHFDTYCKMLEALGGIPLTVRTADLGSDKTVDNRFSGDSRAVNPALGLRAVRLCLREPSLFLPQLRGIIRASAFGPIRMMIPMLSSIEEVHEVIGIVQEIRSEFTRKKISYDETMPIGGMIEVPAAALCAGEFARELDFLSIGTNDLIQYAIAIDRINDEVSYLYNPLNFGVLRLISISIDAARSVGIPISMCGEMAGDPRYTRLLVGLGLKEFSVHPTGILEIKRIIRETSAADSQQLVDTLMSEEEPERRQELLDSLCFDLPPME